MIQQIDTGRCPLPFRKVWLDYVHCWERTVERSSGDGGFGEFLVGAIAAAAGAPHVGVQFMGNGVGQQTKQQEARRRAARNCNEAWRQIESVSIRYGVSARKD
jgi:hypothetical protein